MNEGPKLYANKPKKSQLKPPGSSSMGTEAVSSKPSSLPPQPPKESFARRYKFVWPILLAVNFSIGAYLFMRTKKKDTSTKDDTAESLPSSASITPITTNVPFAEKTITASSTVPVSEKTLSLPKITEPVKLREPIPENQQRELFKWLLEEKRKLKPKDSAEKKQINEEKAILKQFIRAKTIPSL